MKLPLKLYQPLNSLKPAGDQIWIVDGGEVQMAMGLVRVPFSTRMTVVRLTDGSLWLHSPIAPHPDLVAALAALGPVRHLVAPNKIHYSYVAAWKALCPEAEVWLAPGVAERAASQKIAVSSGTVLTDRAPAVWSADLDQSLFQGSRFMQEAVFFHKASRSLIVTDLIENIETDQMGLLQRLLFKLGDNAYPKGRTPRDLRMTFWGGRKQARASFDRIRSWGPDNIILAHGRCHFGKGQAELDRAFSWLT